MARKKPGRGGKREGAGRPAGAEHDGWLRIRAPIELIARVDDAAGAAGVARAAWVRQALEDALKRA